LQSQLANGTDRQPASGTTGQLAARFFILVEVVRLLEHMTSDWDLDLWGGIRPNSRLVRDLGFSSMDIYLLGGRIQQRFDQWDLPFTELHLLEGDASRDLTVAELVDFLHHHLDPARLS
jgi:hypothetical protein